MSFPSANLLLIRHGYSAVAGAAYGPETPLNALGLAQVVAVAEAILKRGPVAAIYASPFPRAIQSAEPLAERTGLELRVDPRLAEFELPASTSDEDQTLPIWRPEHRGSPSSETLHAFSLRVASFLDEVPERHLGETVAVYSHAGTIDAAARWAFGMPPDSSWHHDLPLHPASITELEIWPRGRVPGGAPCYTAFHRIGDATHLARVAAPSRSSREE